MQTESFLMQFFRKLGWDAMAWPFRRLHCPVPAEALVLEVGSGGSPYFRANVLCDAYEDSEERFFAPLISDRPTVIAFVESLPFQDNSFDFLIASHVLEHSPQPELFLREIQRVAKAGYIEVPDAFMERLTHYPFHRLEITDRDGELLIRKKKAGIHDEEVVDLFHNKTRLLFPYWVKRYPFDFHVRYYWSKEKGGIRYRILNPEVNCGWEIEGTQSVGLHTKPSFKMRMQQKILFAVRKLFSQNQRNKNLNIQSLLQCNKCQSIDLKVNVGQVICNKCGHIFKIFMPP